MLLKWSYEKLSLTVSPALMRSAVPSACSMLPMSTSSVSTLCSAKLVATMARLALAESSAARIAPPFSVRASCFTPMPSSSWSVGCTV